MRDQAPQSIVPVHLTNQMLNQPSISPQKENTKLAAKIQCGDKEIRIYNGIDKYILFALLKELS